MNYMLFVFMICGLIGCGQQADDFSQEGQEQPWALFGQKQKVQEEKDVTQKKRPEDAMTIMANVINPFLTTQERKQFKVASFRDLLPLRLTAIFYSEDNSKAIIDGQVLTEGDVFDNKTIIKIAPKEVIMKDERAEFVVPLREIGHEHLEGLVTN